jgi:hypothetical protein
MGRLLDSDKERRKVKYRKKPTLTEATQWFKNGDHPQDQTQSIHLAGGSPGLSEGKVVRYFKSLNIPGGRFCPDCGNVMQKHGLLDTLNGEEIVCPGDYIVTDAKGNYYRLNAATFEAMYEPYEPVGHLITQRET